MKTSDKSAQNILNHSEFKIHFVYIQKKLQQNMVKVVSSNSKMSFLVLLSRTDNFMLNGNNVYVWDKDIGYISQRRINSKVIGHQNTFVIVSVPSFYILISVNKTSRYFSLCLKGVKIWNCWYRYWMVRLKVIISRSVIGKLIF